MYHNKNRKRPLNCMGNKYKWHQHDLDVATAAAPTSDADINAARSLRSAVITSIPEFQYPSIGGCMKNARSTLGFVSRCCTNWTMTSATIHSVLCVLLVVSASAAVLQGAEAKQLQGVLRGVDLNQLTKNLKSSVPVREKRNVDHIITDCIEMKSSEGYYFYKSTSDDDQVCGIYLFTDPDRTIEVYFNYLDVPCGTGLVSFVDGWELNGEYFPGVSEHARPLEERFSEFCGQRRLKQVFRSSQNAALIQYRVPAKTKGFSFTVRFPKNRTPCNILVQDTDSTHTIRNYGNRINCSLTAIFSASVQVLAMNIGLAGARTGPEMETGTIHKCEKRGLDDYVQIGGTEGLDNSHMFVSESFCGLDSEPGKSEINISCGVTSIRLVSSGAYENSVTVSLRQADFDEKTLATSCSPLAV